jgi:trans-aconitate methyltransferase
MKLVSLREIVKSGEMSSLSPLLLIAKELKLNYLIEENGLITGPAVGLSILIDKITKQLPIKSMLDLCCGSGAITKIANRNGVKKIVCVDKNTKAAELNIEKTNGIKIVKEDIMKFEIEDFFDLIVLDAPREILPKISRRFGEFIKKSNIFVLWHGSCEEIEWNQSIRDILRENSKVVYSFSIYGEEISACSSTKIGIEWLRKFYKRW